MANSKGGGGRHTTAPEASLASAILAGRITNPTKAQIKSLAASVLSQDAPKRGGK
jgi:hypothetical protein